MIRIIALLVCVVGSMAMAAEGEWGAKWIGAVADRPRPVKGETADEETYAAPLLRREFALGAGVKRAELRICGLGYFIASINGQRVGDHELDPGFTRYDKRVEYVTHDVTKLLREGKNAIGVMLGGGWYDVATPELFGFHKAAWSAPPKVLVRMEVELTDGSRVEVVSDERWKWSTGEVRFNCIRGGETVDLRRRQKGWDGAGFDESAWQAVKVVPVPAGKLVPQEHPAIRKCGEVPAVELLEVESGAWQWKLAENTAGWAKLRVKGKPGQKITLRCAEEFTKEGGIARGLNSHTYGRYQTEEFYLAGEGEEVLEPHFTYHGFQYVRVEGLSEKPRLGDLVGVKVHTALLPAGAFACSDETINRIHAMAVRTYLANLHGIPTDCPQREKAGWMADGLVASCVGMWNYDAASIYRKWCRDMVDAQLPDGGVPSIVPTPDWNEMMDPWWGGAVVMLPWEHYLHYGDAGILREQYPAMKRYVEYLRGRSKEQIVEWGLGDWLEVGSGGPAARTPIALTSTAGYYRCARIVSETAKMLGNEADAAAYGKLAEEVRGAFNSRFYDAKNKRYLEDSQSAPAMALLFGLAPEAEREAILDGLVRNIREVRRGHVSTGIVATRYLFDALHAAGRDEVAYEMLMQKERPGWIHMIEKGATTLWESWEGNNSHNHPALGAVDAWLYQAIGGITPEAPGFEKVLIAPRPLGGITWAKTSYASVRGKIATEWKVEGGRFVLEVSIPAGVSARVRMPSGVEKTAGAGEWKFDESR